MPYNRAMKSNPKDRQHVLAVALDELLGFCQANELPAFCVRPSVSAVVTALLKE